MPSQKIPWDDKIQFEESPLPENQKFTFTNANDLKSVVDNNADETDAKLGGTITRVLSAVSLVDQNTFPGTDTNVQITFGAAQGTVSDPVRIDALGNLTFNDPGVYLLRYTLVFGRIGSAGVSQLRFRAAYNDVLGDLIIPAAIDGATQVIPYTVPFWVTAAANDTYKAYMRRDSSGNNSGGLFALTSTGWPTAQSAGLQVDKFS